MPTANKKPVHRRGAASVWLVIGGRCWCVTLLVTLVTARPSDNEHRTHSSDIATQCGPRPPPSVLSRGVKITLSVFSRHPVNIYSTVKILPIPIYDLSSSFQSSLAPSWRLLDVVAMKISVDVETSHLVYPVYRDQDRKPGSWSIAVTLATSGQQPASRPASRQSRISVSLPRQESARLARVELSDPAAMSAIRKLSSTSQLIERMGKGRKVGAGVTRYT